MKIENALMRGFYAGLIAGIVGGTWIFIYVYHTQILSGLPDATPSDWLNYLIYHIGIVGIFGGIFGSVYSRFYDGVPGKGVIKGLVFGLMMGMLANIFTSTDILLLWSQTHVDSALEWGVAWIIGFQKWIVYGIFLGILYERLKL